MPWWVRWRFKSPASRLLTQPYVQIKENIKAPRHRPLWGEITGRRWIPRTKRASNVENVSIWWRHHVSPCLSPTNMFTSSLTGLGNIGATFHHWRPVGVVICGRFWCGFTHINTRRDIPGTSVGMRMFMCVRGWGGVRASARFITRVPI